MLVRRPDEPIFPRRLRRSLSTTSPPAAPLLAAHLVTPRLALRHLLVLIVVLTVGTVIGIHDIAAYRALRASATDVASQRLRAAAGQIGQILDAQAGQLRRQIDSVAKHPEVT